MKVSGGPHAGKSLPIPAGFLTEGEMVGLEGSESASLPLSRDWPGSNNYQCRGDTLVHVPVEKSKTKRKPKPSRFL